MRTKKAFKMRRRRALLLLSIMLLLPMISLRPVQAANTSFYLIANHTTAEFDAWYIQADGTATYQSKHNLVHARTPAGVAIDESSNTLFITSEFTNPGFEMIDATTLTPIGIAPGPTNLAGIEVDDANDIVYALHRATNQLYTYDWNPSTNTITPRPGNPIFLPGASGSYGLALDENAGILWVADGYGHRARAYNTTTWLEELSLSFTPFHNGRGPIDIAVDRQRGLVYTVSMSYGAGGPGGSTLISRWSLATATETTFNMDKQGVGVAVDEDTGYVYVTLSPYSGTPSGGQLGIWDPTTFTLVQMVPVTGSPAGICIPQTPVTYNPLNLGKDDGLANVDPLTTIQYNITYDNTLNTISVTNVVITDTLPAEVTYVPASASDGGTYSSGTVTWNLGTLLPNAAGSVTLDVTVNAGTEGLTITNTAAIDCDELGTGYATDHTYVNVPSSTTAHPMPLFSDILAMLPLGIVAGTVVISRRRKTNN